MSTETSDWVVGHPSENKSFVATVVIASLLITSFFVGTGFMLYFWIKSWRGKDSYALNVSEGTEGNEKVRDLEAQRPGTPPPPPDDSNYESDESPIVEVSKWRQETVSIDKDSSQASSTRASSEVSINDYTPERPRSRDFHELYPSSPRQT